MKRPFSFAALFTVFLTCLLALPVAAASVNPPMGDNSNTGLITIIMVGSGVLIVALVLLTVFMKKK